MSARTAAKASDGTTSKRQSLIIKEVTADIWQAPPNSVLIHACNCFGSWGAGIAGAFKQGYPNAHKKHKQYCNRSPDGVAQVGSAQLIPPLDEDPEDSLHGYKKHYIGCLFTSLGYSSKVDPPERILKNTGPAIIDLLKQIAEVKRDGGEIGEIRMCKINSALFRTPWEETLKVLENIELEPDMPTVITVFNQPK